MKFIKYPLFFVLAQVLIFSACEDDDPVLPNQDQDDVVVLDSADQQIVETNNWIYDVMKDVYYWTDDLPAKPDTLQNPSDFFFGLLSSEDRFSTIVPDYDELLNNLSGVSEEAGYEFMLAKEQNTDNVLAIVLYVKKDSPADFANLKRGDVISQINGTTITIDNYKMLLPEIYQNHSIKYKRFNEELASYEEKGTLDLNAVVVSENPNYLDTVYTIGSKKIGYYVYTFFSPGTDNSTIYDDQMDQIIGNFKNEGVTDLVIDLRYNSGGAGSSARNMASLLAPNVTSSDIFYKNQYNDLYQEFFLSKPDGEARLQVPFEDKMENIGSQIGADLYVLTGTRTASASELVINGLDPYMTVTLIGETTVGKNVGSIPIQNVENPEIDYGLLPIVVKVFNSAGFSDYNEGFTPLGENFVKDFQQPLKALGDTEEPLLARAIEVIAGTAVSGRKSKFSGEVVTPIMTSIDLKTRSNRLIMEDMKK